MSLAQVSTREVTKELSRGANLTVGSGAGASGVGLSPDIWDDCPLLQMMVDPTLGIYARDFMTAIQATGYPYEISGTNGTFTALADNPGVGRLSAPGTDNDEAHIAYNNDVAGLIKCDPSHKWWFEARVKLSQITVEGGVLVGLLQQAASQDAIMATNTMILTATLDYLGFQIVEAAATSLVWRTIKQLASRTAVNEAAAPASTSWVKLGMKSVPNTAGTIATITFYVNGVALPNTTTSDSTNYPLNVYLTPQFGVKTGAGSAFNVDISWWQAAQLK